MTLEAGVILANAQQAAAERRADFPAVLGSEGSCTIGGNLSTNAGGIAALAYGVARDLVLGLEVVLADGRIMHGLSSLKKDNTGYDLRDLFVGAEGTLGIITARDAEDVSQAALGRDRLRGNRVSRRCPQAARHLAQYRCRQPDQLRVAAADRRLTSRSSMGHPSARRWRGPHPWYVLMEISSPRDDARDTIEAILGQGMEDGIVLDAVLAANLDQRNAFWKLREIVSPAQKPEGGSIKHDVSVPVAAVPDFLIEADAAVTNLIPGARPFAFGHLGDGNIHYNISQPVGADSAEFLARWRDVNSVVHGIVAKHGGSISAEHGIGILKRDELPHVKDPVALAIMRSIKANLDPLNIMNPGKVL